MLEYSKYVYSNQIKSHSTKTVWLKNKYQVYNFFNIIRECLLNIFFTSLQIFTISPPAWWKHVSSQLDALGRAINFGIEWGISIISIIFPE